MTSRTRNVGTGSSEQDLLGDFMMIRQISVCVHGPNAAIDDGADAVVVGLGDWALAAMTSSTLRLKYAAKPSAVAPVTLQSRPSIEDSDRHNIGDELYRVQQCGPSSTPPSCLCRRVDGGEPRRPTGADQRQNMCASVASFETPACTKWRRNIAENFNHLSRVHERYRQIDDKQTDGRRHIANVNARSLKTSRVI